MEAITWVGLFLGSLLGGFLFAKWFRAPYLLQALLMTVAMILAMFLKEPMLDSRKYHPKDFVVQNIRGFRELFHNARTTRMVLIFVTLGAGYYIAAQILGISQAKEYGIAPQFVGVLFAAGYIIAALSSKFYPQLRTFLGSQKLLFLAAAALLASFFLANFVGLYLGAFLIFMRIASSTVFRNTRSIRINTVISSKNRATALSTLNMLTMLPYALLAVFIGKIIDASSPNTFALIMGVVITVLLAGEVLLLPKDSASPKNI